MASDSTGAINELGLEKYVGVVPHALLQRYDQELRLRKVFLQHHTDILCVGQVQGRIDLIQNIQRSRLESQQRQDQ